MRPLVTVQTYLVSNESFILETNIIPDSPMKNYTGEIDWDWFDSLISGEKSEFIYRYNLVNSKRNSDHDFDTIPSEKLYAMKDVVDNFTYRKDLKQCQRFLKVKLIYYIGVEIYA